MPDERTIREGGYQPTKDPPSRPPSVVIKPATPPAPNQNSGGEGSSGS